MSKRDSSYRKNGGADGQKLTQKNRPGVYLQDEPSPSSILKVFLEIIAPPRGPKKNCPKRRYNFWRSKVMRASRDLGIFLPQRAR